MSVPEEGRFLPWRSAGPCSALSSLPGASPGAGESLLSSDTKGMEGGRQRAWGWGHGGTCRVTRAQQCLLRVVLGICNSRQDPSTPELGLFLGLHMQPLSCSASALLSPKWGSSHVNKPTCVGDCKPEALSLLPV